MKLELILSLIISLLLTILSAWSFSTFSRLDTAAKNYEIDTTFQTACHVTKNYVKTSKLVSLLTLILALLIMNFVSIMIYKKL